MTLIALKQAVAEHRLLDQRELLTAFENCEAPPPDRDEWFVLLAEHAIQSGDPVTVRALCRRGTRAGVSPALLHRFRLSGHMLRHRFGAALEELRAHEGEFRDDLPLLELRIVLLGNLRRLKTARREWQSLRDRADELGADSAPLQLLDARLLWMEDETERAHRAFVEHEAAWGDRPRYWTRRAYQELELGRLDAALVTVEEGRRRFPQNGDTLYAVSSVLAVFRRFEESRQALVELLELCPRLWLRKHVEGLVENLEHQAQPDVLLDVPTLQQRRQYCGPNSLSLLSRFWGHEIAQEEIAKDILDAGTSNERMRRWSREHGYTVRGFQGTPQSIRALLDRGIPILTDRLWTFSGHYYIFVGHGDDGSRFFLRDPDAAHLVELRDEEFDSWFGSHDHWCLAIVPDDKAALLDAVDLPDHDPHEELDRWFEELYARDPQEILREVEACDFRETPNTVDRLRIALAEQTGDTGQLTQVAEQWMARRPEDPVVLARCTSALFASTPAERCLELTTRSRELSRDHYVESLHARALTDLGRVAEARQVVRSMVRRMPTSPLAHLAEADLALAEGGEERALRSLEVAAEIDTQDPYMLTRWATTLRRVGHHEGALARLTDALRQRPRFPYARHEHALCLRECGRFAEALDAFEKNVAEMPWHAANALDAARLLRDLGRWQDADRLLERAQETASPVSRIVVERAHDLRGRGERERALEVLVPFLHGERPAPALRAAAAAVELDLGLYDACIGRLVPVLEEATDWSYPYHTLTTAYRRSGRFEEAAEVLWKYVRRNPHSGAVDSRLQAILGESQRPRALCDHLRSLLNAPGRTAGQALRLAALLRNEGQLEEARAAVQRASELDPEESWVHTFLGDLAWDEQNYERAAAHYQDALALRPSYLHAHRQLARTMVRRGERDAALEHAYSAVALDSSELSLVVEIFADLSQNALAYDTLTSERERFLPRADVEFQLGQISWNLGEMERARGHYERAAELAPNHVDARVLLAIDAMNRQDFATARTQFQGALRLDPGNLFAASRMARFLFRQGEHEEAIALLQHTLELAPGNDDLYIELRTIFEMRSDLDGGTKVFEQLAERAPDASDPLAHLGLLQHQQERPELARASFLRAAEVRADSPWIERLLGIVELRLRDPEAALERFRNAKRLDPSDSFADRADRLHLGPARCTRRGVPCVGGVDRAGRRRRPVAPNATRRDQRSGLVGTRRAAVRGAGKSLAIAGQRLGHAGPHAHAGTGPCNGPRSIRACTRALARPPRRIAATCSLEPGARRGRSCLDRPRGTALAHPGR